MNSHLQSVLCNLLYDRAGVGNGLQLSDTFDTWLTNRWELFKVLVYKLHLDDLFQFILHVAFLKLTDYY